MPRAICLIWELPLAVGSRLLFVAVRSALRRIVTMKLRRNRRMATGWQFLDETLLQQRYALPAVMTEGPRWNTHAVIGRVGPLAVNRSISVQGPPGAAAARAWTIVVYTFPQRRTVTTVHAESLSKSDDWTEVSLPPANYSLIARYYEPPPNCQLPAIRVDGVPQVSQQEIPGGINEFYETLSRRRNFVYTVLHYHAYFVVKFRRWLPDSLVERIYLPVGNPETQFRYGAMAPSESLCVELPDGMSESCDVYITFYDVASFPIHSERLTNGRRQWKPRSQRCTFLIRIHQHYAASRLPDGSGVEVTVLPVGTPSLVDSLSQGASGG